MYKSAAEKQKAYRVRHGQKPKVPLEIRRGEKLGSGEAEIRGKLPNETWEDYSKYILRYIALSHRALGSRTLEKERQDQVETAPKATRRVGKYIEPSMSEDYYEISLKYEKELEEIPKKGGKMKKK